MTALNYAVAPGEYLEEWIEDNGWTQQKTADHLGCTRKHLIDLLNGRAKISDDMALRLERLTGIRTDAWMRREARYRAQLAYLRDQHDLGQHAEKISDKAIKYLRDRGAITVTRRKPGQLVSDFLAFHRCGTWEAYEAVCEGGHQGDYALAALKEARATLDPTLLSVWLRAGELTQAYERGRALSYSEEGLKRLIPRLRERCARPDDVMLSDVASMLAEVGVVFMVINPPSGLPLRAMTRWIDKRVPVIQQTERWKKDGFAIWYLFHELGHVLHDPRGELHLEYSTEKKRNSAAEREANKFAMETLFGEGGIQQFFGLAHDHEIVEKAREVGVAPGLVVHQLHRRQQLDRRYGNRLFVDLSGTFPQES